MESFAKIPHKLSRDGFSQLDRENKVLSPASIEIDGRETGDLLQFLYQYSRQINYYDVDSHNRAGDWIPFFRDSIPFQYAVISSYDIDLLEERFQKVEKAIRSRLSNESLNLLYDLIFDMTDQLARWLDDLKNDSSGLKKVIENLIETNLSDQYKKLLLLSNSAGKWGYKRKKNIETAALYLVSNPMDLYGIDKSILALKGSQKNKVLGIFARLEELYRTFWKSMQTIIAVANDGDQLEKSLSEVDQNHEPHLGLIFAFLKLFKEAQGGLNELSEDHLDFFYRKTLALQEQDFVPDHAHLTFELAKKVKEDILIEKGTRFKAGKDSAGKDMFFELEEELIVTTAKVADLRTLYIDRVVSEANSEVPPVIEENYKEDIHIVDGVYMAPVANSADGLGEGFVDETEARWPTVGSLASKWTDPDTAQITNHPHARLGFMLAAKVLFLREGERTLEIVLTLNENLGQNSLPADLFNIALTTEKGWLQLSDHSTPIVLGITVVNDKITINITLPTDFPAVMAADPALLETDYGNALPMIKFELNQTATNNAGSHYALLRRKELCEVDIKVRVCDVRQLVIQNDLALLDINKPFTPFGPLPKKNSSNFYIGSEEIFCKRWNTIEINPIWKDLPGGTPPDFPGYYGAYGNAISPGSNDDFVADIEVLSERDWLPLAEDVKLFSPADVDLIPECSNTDNYWAVNSNADAEICSDLSDIQNGYQADTPCGFIRMKLGDQDFLHDQYANVLISKVSKVETDPTLADSIESLEEEIEALKEDIDDTDDSLNTIDCDDDGNLVNKDTTVALMVDVQSSYNDTEDAVEDIRNVVDSQLTLPNPPYTPLIESLSLNYSAQANTTTNDEEIFFTHLHPFEGTYEHLEVDNDTYASSVLPCFVDEGNLYVGLEEYEPGSNLNLFFQMEPASANPDVDKAVVCWEYLRNNEWKPLLIDTQVLSDTTNGLIQSGIVQFTIPSDISLKETTILPNTLHWIKARVLFRTAAISETLVVQSQSARVVFVPGEENDLSRLDTPLAAKKIAKLESPIAAIKGVDQPFNSFNGCPQEAASNFQQRISEHMRHKGRAIALRDYERLTLQYFKDIYKVKCITHTLGRRGQQWDFELAPGFVTIVVVPDLSIVKAVDPIKPLVPAATLSAVKKLLASKTSPFVRIEVLNPIFETINVSASVKFKAGKSNTFYKEKLSEDVKEFLAPWAFSDTRQDISFGGKIFYSTILKFIEDRSYVDFLIDFKMSDDNGEIMEVITASNSRVVLTSGTHDFTPIESTDELLDLLAQASASTKKGIGTSEIPKQ